MQWGRTVRYSYIAKMVVVAHVIKLHSFITMQGAADFMTDRLCYIPFLRHTSTPPMKWYHIQKEAFERRSRKVTHLLGLHLSRLLRLSPLSVHILAIYLKLPLSATSCLRGSWGWFRLLFDHATHIVRRFGCFSNLRFLCCWI
jgi:hypothetical protein